MLENKRNPAFLGVFFEISLERLFDESLNTLSELDDVVGPIDILLEILLGVDCFPGRL